MALAPTDFVNIRNSGAGGTRSFMPFMSSGFLILLVRRDMTLTVIGQGDDLVPRLILVALGDVAEQLAMSR